MVLVAAAAALVVAMAVVVLQLTVVVATVAVVATAIPEAQTDHHLGGRRPMPRLLVPAVVCESSFDMVRPHFLSDGVCSSSFPKVPWFSPNSRVGAQRETLSRL